MDLVCLAPREASIFACLVDTVAAPEPLLPAVAQTDCAFAFDRWMAASPTLNALGMRALLLALEMLPLAMAYGARFRRLPVEERARFVKAIERSSNKQLRQLIKVLKGAAFLSYYGDDDVMRRIGYDAAANVERARSLRLQDGRP
jgi:ferric-dicitrate binding protein FerR (iron transport regulator)